MQQIRIFKGPDEELIELQQEVNDWLAESGVRVIQITGNIAPPGVVSHAPTRGLGTVAGRFAHSDIFIIVLYEDAE